MKRRYFVKSILFLLLTAMVLLSVTAYGDNAGSEGDSELSILETEAPETAIPAEETFTPGPTEAPTPEPETEIPTMMPDPEGEMNEEDTVNTPVPDAEPSEDGEAAENPDTPVPSGNVPTVAPDPEWAALFENAPVYTGKLNSGSTQNDAVLKIADNGTCEITVLCSYFADGQEFFFDFYTKVPGLGDKNAKLYVQSKGTYMISEDGVFSATFDRSAAYVVFSPDSVDAFPENAYYTALFEGKFVDLTTCGYLFELSLDATIDSASGTFLPRNFVQKDARKMTIAEISYLYKDEYKYRERHAIYDRQPSDFPTVEEYETWPLNRFYDQDFRTDGSKRSERTYDGARRILTGKEFSKDGSCICIVRYQNGGMIECEAVNGTIEATTSYGEQVRKIYDADGNFVKEIRFDEIGSAERYFDAEGNRITEGYFSHGYDAGRNEYIYDERGLLVWFGGHANGKLEVWVDFVYSEDGIIQKSDRYDRDGTPISHWLYDENGQLKESRLSGIFMRDGEELIGWWVTYYGAAENGGNLTVVYDEKGNQIDQYIS